MKWRTGPRARRGVSCGHPNPTVPDVAGSAVGHRAGPLRQNLARLPPTTPQWARDIAAGAPAVPADPLPWLAWTVAGLFYITQDSVPRLYRGRADSLDVFVGWMAGDPTSVTLTPAVLWLGRRCPSGAASRASPRSPSLRPLQLGMLTRFFRLVGGDRSADSDGARCFPRRVPPSSVAEGVSVLLSFGPKGASSATGRSSRLQAVYRSHQNAQAREREAFELKVHSSSSPGSSRRRSSARSRCSCSRTSSSTRSAPSSC